MDARLIFSEEYPIGDDAMVRIVVWELPRKLGGSDHHYKYSLSLVAGGLNVLRYDNEAGKGDHRHVGRREFPYRFVDMDELQADFWKDVEEWQRSKKRS